MPTQPSAADIAKWRAFYAESAARAEAGIEAARARLVAKQTPAEAGAIFRQQCAARAAAFVLRRTFR